MCFLQFRWGPIPHVKSGDKTFIEGLQMQGACLRFATTKLAFDVLTRLCSPQPALIRG